MPRLLLHRRVLTGLLVVALAVHLYGLYDPTPTGGGLEINDKLVHGLLFGVPALLGSSAGRGPGGRCCSRSTRR